MNLSDFDAFDMDDGDAPDQQSSSQVTLPRHQFSGSSLLSGNGTSNTMIVNAEPSALGKRAFDDDADEMHENEDNKIAKFNEGSDVKVLKPPAKVYKFNLDGFQREAIGYIERDESVLVAAHTSAGKTAVAEYAIAKSLRDKQRVIYTSPIKALSNQKFRDLQEEFGDVGLMTGDMTINPNATCLIMTTEILRSMLYRGSEVVREVAWVIYDEVHYMRDKERGVVWEESIILLPHKVRFVFLSATIPNAASFVAWVSKIHHQPCHVVYTDYRPVPLQHYLFPAAADGLYLVVDEKSKFRDDNFQRAMSSLQSNPLGELDPSGNGTDKNDKKSRKKLTKDFQSDLSKIVKLIMERSLDPCIIFSFSKKDCESYALLMSKMDFTNEEEKKMIDLIFNNAIEALSEDDKQLPQIVTILPLLKRGVGIHHGGLLPILKEIIELLFQEGLIKVLFATETFSIGINMPAKTVVFTATRKYDGKDFRWITSGEYIQMSGRAGRRGKDDKGIVIQMIDEKMEPDVVKNMIYGASDPLYSSYHISYNMVLNMLRVEGADPSNLIRNSFHQFQQEANAPNLLLQAQELEKEKNRIAIDDEKSLLEYFKWRELLGQFHREINQKMMHPGFILPFLQNGRLVQVQSNEEIYGWGVIVEIKKTSEIMQNMKLVNKHLTMSAYLGKVTGRKLPESEYVIEILIEVCRLTTPRAETGLEIAPKLLASEEKLLSSSKTSPAEGRNEMAIIQCGIDCLGALSAIRLNIPKDLSKEKYRVNIRNTINEIIRRFESSSSSSETNNNKKLLENGKSEGGQSSSSVAAVQEKSSAILTKGIPLLDPKADLGLTNTEEIESIYQQLSRKSELLHRLQQNKYYTLDKSSPTAASLLRDLTLYQTKVQLDQEMIRLRKEATELQSVVMKEELRKMKRVLKKLGYIDQDQILTKRGRFACEVTAGDEIVITNMVFAGLFNDLSLEQTVALLSCFVHNEGGGSSSGGNSGTNAASEQSILKFKSEMHKPFRQMMVIIKEIVAVYKDNNILLEEDDYINSFNPILIDVTYAWAQGQRFLDICKISEVFEGSIIRSLRRLDELLRQLAGAALAIGNQELVTRFTDASNKIRRGVVFAASLYI